MGKRGQFASGVVNRLRDPGAWTRFARSPGQGFHTLRRSILHTLYDADLKHDPVRDAAMVRDAAAALARFAGAVRQVPVQEFHATPEAIELGKRFQLHGSDKSTAHDYHLLYGSLLEGCQYEQLRILEFGLGTNHIDVPFHMGLDGKPGASLRAWRDWAPHAEIFGADIDRRILFSEERIATFFVDQTKAETLTELARNFAPGSLDLVVDDGLHTPDANLNVILFALPLVKPGGAIVIEDIQPEHLDFWKIFARVVPPGFEFTVVAAKGGYLSVLQRS